MDCPRCGSSDVTESHRRGGEKLMRYIIPRTPYRCKECWSRFWKFENPLKTAKAKIAAVLIAGGVLVVFLTIPLLSRPPKPVVPSIPVPPEKSSEALLPKEEPLPPKDPEKIETVNDQDSIRALLNEEKVEDVVPDKKTEDGSAKAEPEAGPEPSESGPKSVETKTPAVLKQQPEKVSAPAPVAASGARVLTGIWHSASEGEFRMALSAGGPIDDFKYFMMEGPTRLVINLKGRWEYPGKPSRIATGDIVKQIRVGEHPDHLSVVLDFREDLLVKRYIEASDQGLSIIVRRNGK